MLRFVCSVICAALLSAAATWFLPWWTLSIVCFSTAIVFRLKPGSAFLSGFLAIALLWSIWGWYLSAANHYLLLDKMARIFQLHQGWMYIAVSALIGGIAGAFSSWSGSLLMRRHSVVTR